MKAGIVLKVSVVSDPTLRSILNPPSLGLVSDQMIVGVKNPFTFSLVTEMMVEEDWTEPLEARIIFAVLNLLP